MKLILDACCGCRMFWFNKNHPSVLFQDIRREEHILCDGRKLMVNPDIIADFRSMPHKDCSFHLVVFDPPHIKGAGKNGWLAKKYGVLGDDWRDVLASGFRECMRVLKPNGTLIFKWNEESIKVSDVIKAIGQEPLFGHKTLQSSKTIWMAFMKEIK